MYNGFIIFLRYTVFLIIDFNFELAFIKPNFFLCCWVLSTRTYTRHNTLNPQKTTSGAEIFETPV